MDTVASTALAHADVTCELSRLGGVQDGEYSNPQRRLGASLWCEDCSVAFCDVCLQGAPLEGPSPPLTPATSATEQ
eukprot:12912586-Prorocentrum_lima.AAC.1